MRILFVSAPFGPFFAAAALALENSGCRVWRSVCEGGDFIETPARHRIVWRGDIAWKSFVSNVCVSKRIDAVVTFNDTSLRNREALGIAKALGLTCWVLENGYLRPHWVTFDRDGVNGHSALPRDPSFYLAEAQSGAAGGPACRDPVTFPAGLRPHVVHTIGHFAAAVALSPFLRFDPKYYGDGIYRQMAGYVREYAWRKLHPADEMAAKIAEWRSRSQDSRVFAVLLQKPGDGQIRVHSPFASNAGFLAHVVASFARHAPRGVSLVVKQHPLDYGVERLPAVFAAAVREHGLEDRAIYIRKTSIEKVFDAVDGVVTMNSTGGLGAVSRGLPAICLGNAFYDMPGLTHQSGLERFWVAPQHPRAHVVSAFLAYLQRTSQLNGGFHTSEGRALLVRRLCDVILGVREEGRPGTVAVSDEAPVQTDQGFDDVGHEGLVPATA